jgi:hypothetical protein
VQYSTCPEFDDVKDYVRSHIDSWKIDEGAVEQADALSENSQETQDPVKIDETPGITSGDGRAGLDLSCVYETLPEPDGIRLLRLHGSESISSPIHCSLEVHHLRDPAVPVFEALSYTWADLAGDATLCKPIYLGRDYAILLVTKNCESALRHVRTRLDRLIWVDAICIHQSDLSEGEHQVLLMREIYTFASRVVIYLGPGTDDTREAMSIIRSNPRQLSNQKTRVLLDFMERPYFRRAWVVQEVKLAQRALMMCGTDTVHWDEFRALLNHAQFVRIFSDKIAWARENPISLIRLLLATRGLSCADPRDRLYSLLGLYERSQREIMTEEQGRLLAEKLLTLARTPGGLDHSLQELQEQIRQGAPPLHKTEREANWISEDESQPSKIKSSIKEYGPVATDSGMTAHELPIDYTLSIQQVYTGLASYFLKKGSGRIWRYLERRKSTKYLPSWVPDWGSLPVEVCEIAIELLPYALPQSAPYLDRIFLNEYFYADDFEYNDTRELQLHIPPRYQIHIPSRLPALVVTGFRVLVLNGPDLWLTGTSHKNIKLAGCAYGLQGPSNFETLHCYYIPIFKETLLLKRHERNVYSHYMNCTIKCPVELRRGYIKKMEYDAFEKWLFLALFLSWRIAFTQSFDLLPQRWEKILLATAFTCSPTTGEHLYDGETDVVDTIVTAAQLEQLASIRDSVFIALSEIEAGALMTADHAVQTQCTCDHRDGWAKITGRQEIWMFNSPNKLVELSTEVNASSVDRDSTMHQFQQHLIELEERYSKYGGMTTVLSDVQETAMKPDFYISKKAAQVWPRMFFSKMAGTGQDEDYYFKDWDYDEAARFDSLPYLGIQWTWIARPWKGIVQTMINQR